MKREKPMTATEVEQRWEVWKTSPEAKAVAKELEEKVINPILMPMIDHMIKFLKRDGPES